MFAVALVVIGVVTVIVGVIVTIVDTFTRIFTRRRCADEVIVRVEWVD